MARIWCTDRTGIHPASDGVKHPGKLGSSRSPYDSLNLGLKVGDDRNLVISNRRELSEALGLLRIRFMDQIHSALMVNVAQEIDEPECDGIFLIKDDWNLGVGLAVQVADCVPVIITSENLIAAIHIGRDGLIAGMTESALDALAVRVEPNSLHAVIGPSICGDCYPNSSEMFARCTSRYPATSHSSDQSKLDVAAGVISILEDRGVSWNWFGGARECVSCDDRYYSYRRASTAGDGLTGRQAMVVSW